MSFKISWGDFSWQHKALYGRSWTQFLIFIKFNCFFWIVLKVAIGLIQLPSTVCSESMDYVQSVSHLNSNSPLHRFPFPRSAQLWFHSYHCYFLMHHKCPPGLIFLLCYKRFNAHYSAYCPLNHSLNGCSHSRSQNSLPIYLHLCVSFLCVLWADGSWCLFACFVPSIALELSHHAEPNNYNYHQHCCIAIIKYLSIYSLSFQYSPVTVIKYHWLKQAK